MGRISHGPRSRCRRPPKCAVPVYGCGALGHNSVWKDDIFPTSAKSDVARGSSSGTRRSTFPTQVCRSAGSRERMMARTRWIRGRSPTSFRPVTQRCASGWPCRIVTRTDGRQPKSEGLCRFDPLPTVRRCRGSPVQGGRGRRIVAHFTSVRPVMRAETLLHPRAREVGGPAVQRPARPLTRPPDRVEADIPQEQPSPSSTCTTTGSAWSYMLHIELPVT